VAEVDQSNKERRTNKEFNRLLLIVGILSVLFFIASAYGVQRTILSTFAEEEVPIEEWFETGGWLSVAFTLSSFGLFKAGAGFFTGVSTKNIRTKTIILIGTGFFSLGSVPLLFSQGNPILLSIGNAFLGAGEGLLYAGAMTYLSDISTPSRRAFSMGIMELSVYGGYSFGALISGFITMVTASISISFFFSTIVAVIALLLAFFTIKSEMISDTQLELTKLRTPVEEPETSTRIRSLIFRPTVVIIFINGHISKMVDSIIVLFLPLVLSKTFNENGLLIEEVGLITAVFTLSWALVMPLAGRISDRIGRKPPISIGLLLEAFALLGLAGGSPPFLVSFGYSILGGIGVGLYYPILPSISVDIAPEAKKSRIIGLYRATKDLGYFTGPLIAGMAAQYWYFTDSRLEQILRIPLTLASILLIIGAISLIIVRETRPGWGQFQTTLQHAQLVEESVIQATKGLLVYLEQQAMEDSEFNERLSRYSIKAKNLELQADRQLEEIVVQTYRSLHKSPDAGNFLRIARRLDRAAGLSLGALYRIQVIPFEEIPALIQEKLHDASIVLRSLVRTTVDVLQVLEIKLDAVTGVYHLIRERETDLDLLYQMMNRQLFLSAQEIHYGTWFAIRDVINMIEQAADSTEDAAEVINILAIKYKT
jgi:MFS family permease